MLFVPRIRPTDPSASTSIAINHLLPPFGGQSAHRSGYVMDAGTAFPPVRADLRPWPRDLGPRSARV
jgi:hypothetical protein